MTTMDSINGGKMDGGAPVSQWEGRLILGARGPRAILANAMTALRLAPEWQGRLAYDETRKAVMLRAAPPWHDEGKDGPWGQRQGSWTDIDDIRLAEWLQRRGIYVKPGVAAQAVDAVARENSYHAPGTQAETAQEETVP